MHCSCEFSNISCMTAVGFGGALAAAWIKRVAVPADLGLSGGAFGELFGDGEIAVGDGVERADSP